MFMQLVPTIDKAMLATTIASKTCLVGLSFVHLCSSYSVGLLYLQVVNFNSNKLGMVRDHLGHSLKFHTTVYKTQQNIIERSKVACILALLESGSVYEI